MKRALLFALLLAGCKTKAAPPDAAPPPKPVVAVVDAGPTGLTAAQRAEVLKNLNAGRMLATAKEWSGAIDAFNRALVLAPDDGRVLSELGWAEFNANDLAKAEAANTRALANVREPTLRAPILYNVGRVAEQRGNNAAAAKAYRESLALRPNAEVKRRLVALGVDAGGEDVTDGITGTPCAQGFSSIGAMCLCLESNKDNEAFYMPEDMKPECKLETTRAPLGDPRVSTLMYGAGSQIVGETLHYLTVRETDRTRMLALLGVDFEPGAFGVHNQTDVLGGSSRNVGGHVIVVIKTKKNNVDLNLAGLELCFDRATQETVCALSDDHGGSKCTPPIPLDAESGCGANESLTPDDLKDLDPTTKEIFANMKKNGSKSSVKTSWGMSDDGTVTVTVKEGTRDLVPANVLEPHRLFAQ